MNLSASVILVILLTGCFSTIVQAEESISRDPSREINNDFIDNETAILAAEYKTLRKQLSHWKGDNWNDDIDKYGGRMHQVLLKLEDKIDGADFTRSQVVDLMGAPDAVRRNGDNELLIYFWRGWHDYLYFTCQGESVKGSDWYFAYD